MSNPTELLELMEGARNCVACGAVKEGEEVLIWADRTGKVDPLVIQAISLAAEEKHAIVTLVYDNPPEFRLGGRISRTVESMLKSADVTIQVLDLCNVATVDNRYIFNILFEYDTRMVAVIAPTRNHLASSWAKFPLELAGAIYRKANAQVKDAPFRLTDPNGTDLTGRLKSWPGGVIPQGGPALRSGGWTFFPSGNVALHPESPVNGVVVFETLEGFEGILKEPVRLTVEDHWVTKVEGGDEARWLERMMRRYENGHYFCEVAWGTCPKASLSRGLTGKAPDTELYRRAGAFHCGVGLWPGEGLFCDLHWDGGGINPTLYIGDELVIDNGHLTVLDDLEVRAIAAKYGDPDDLLMMEP